MFTESWICYTSGSMFTMGEDNDHSLNSYLQSNERVFFVQYISIFLQELTRRGLSRAGMRQDLIDRLLAAINGIITDDAKDSNENTPSNTSGPEKSLIEANVQSDLESADKEVSFYVTFLFLI